MDTIVLKFGGSSVADNIKLNLVADKIKEFYNNNSLSDTAFTSSKQRICNANVKI